ncbi:4'-phosphopantetheinyl transferase superfamily protein [Flavobacterium sp. K5-23]|uniref:4'-phosphopantetheinyl transferase family protein n=1 Tax=Flavobacterium sp. K5-23 TaxID=2746225 RepID=UPI00200C8FA1|nr:4'-phosphopantetheinyl transferase superfamily protein [Flavobacterium sp. K5-23]UQD56989.1 4-phosphopantetheinyl transferase family protein [Flavobacterium sp. K5-23]
MIGNDIVDLALARKESNWKRKGFLDKIFTIKEQFLINSAENPEIMVWNLWSRKEAAYKIYNRQTGIRAYIPIQLECVYGDENSGSVLCDGNEYYTQTKISNDCIYTVAVTDSSHFKKIVLLDPNILISKDDGKPFITDNNGLINKAVSVSHHGRFQESIMLTE